MKHAFTLIELSIVLIIIGLLVGGILAAQTLVQHAKIRAIYTEYQTFELATNAYILKYGAKPGDDSQASLFF